MLSPSMRWKPRIFDIVVSSVLGSTLGKWRQKLRVGGRRAKDKSLLMRREDLGDLSARCDNMWWWLLLNSLRKRLQGAGRGRGGRGKRHGGCSRKKDGSIVFYVCRNGVQFLPILVVCQHVLCLWLCLRLFRVMLQREIWLISQFTTCPRKGECGENEIRFCSDGPCPRVRFKFWGLSSLEQF